MTGNSWQLFKYLLSVSPLFSFFLCISTLVSVGGGVNQPSTSISNSLCSPYASRGSDSMLRTRKARAFTTVSQRDGALSELAWNSGHKIAWVRLEGLVK